MRSSTQLAAHEAVINIESAGAEHHNSIKDFLEEQFAGCLGQGATSTRIAIPSAGVKYTWDGSKACGARISNLTVTAGAVTDTIVNATGTLPNPSKTYRVTVNSFMADGGDGYSTLKKGTDRLGGAQDIDALVAFMAGFKAPAAPYTPSAVANDAGTPRIGRVGAVTPTPACPGGADTNP